MTAFPFRRPRTLLIGYIFFSIVLWTVQCSVLQNILGLDILETVVWGARHAWGSSKHPPLSGWIGGSVSFLCGRHDWGMYLICQICLAIGVWFVYKTVRLFRDENFSVLSAMLLYFLPYYLPSWMKFSTYFVEIALIPPAAFFFFSALKDSGLRNWLMFGILCGFGILNKYSFALQIAGFGLILLAEKEARKEWRKPGLYLAFAVGVLMILPHLCWLWQNGFACLDHVGRRMNEERYWYAPLLCLATGLYPLLITLGIAAIAFFPKSCRGERVQPDRVLSFRTAVLTGIPIGAYILLSLKEAVILMWFCTTASWVGALAASLLPFRVTERIVRRVFVLLLIATSFVLLLTTLDLMLKPRKRIHARPETIVSPARACWEETMGKRPIPVVFGDLWYGGVLENYTPERPPLCEAEDDLCFRLYARRIAEQGAVIIGDEETFRDFEKRTGVRVSNRLIHYSFRTLTGAEKTSSFDVGICPPGAFRPADR